MSFKLERNIFILIAFFLLSDLQLCALYSTGWISVSVVKLMYYLVQLGFLLVTLRYCLSHKVYRLKMSVFIFVLAYFLVPYSIFPLLEGRAPASIASGVITMMIPFLTYGMGLYFGVMSGNMRKLLSLLFLFALVVSFLGMVELFWLDHKFFYDHLYIQKYFSDIKGYTESMDFPFHDGAISRPEFYVLGVDHRMGSVFLEPLTAGIFVGSIFLASIFYFSHHFGSAILFIAVVLTQSRSSLLFLFIPLLVRAAKSYTHLLFLVVGGVAFMVVMFEYVERSVTTLGGKGHQEGISHFAGSLLDVSYFFGQGAGVVTLEESGYGFVYSQYGYIGLVLFILFMVFVLYRILVSNRWYLERMLGASLVISTLVIMNFNNYPFSYKSYFFIWFFLGYISTRQLEYKQC